ncbi:histidine phosphatase family protein [Nostoc sp. LEGE 12447]|uniref:SixA phosphatase family protein n=1 Tax=Nostoc sp. LEGE 12447 TaxID=1828640 RepID=UPI00188321BF|nr:histidine phosphatase family protein [Nostoc sp. LEGE 12447]MBE9003452.1 histidine phosphatase family protein [Nostoc sp. LEGE 12447]
MDTEKSHIQIILIRHGLKQVDKLLDDADKPLSLEGCEQVKQLANKLACQNLKPMVFFASPYLHAKQTADILRKSLSGKLVVLNSMKPSGGQIKSFDKIVNEANQIGEKLSHLEVVAFVGHEPKISQLLRCLAQDQRYTLNRAEAVCLEGTYEDFLQGKGKFKWCISSDKSSDNNDCDKEIENQLREKVKSKMTVSTFLAGFTFTVLNDFLKEGNLNIPQIIAVLFMTAAMSLFVASLYMYDQMLMPKKYWFNEVIHTTHSNQAHNLLYRYMVRTWYWVFTPGVAFALIGLIATLFNTSNYLVIFIGIVIFAVIILYYFRMKPILGQD